MSVFTDHLGFLRTEFTAAMVDTATVTRTTARGTFNTSTGVYDSPTVVTVYTGSALFLPNRHSNRDYGFENVETSEMVVLVPHTAAEVQPEDVVTCDASSKNTVLVGESFTVRAAVEGSHHARRKLLCEWRRE